MQFLILCTICIFLFSTSADSNSFYNSLSLISIASPLFVLTNIEELTKVYNSSILEIEFSTKIHYIKLLLLECLYLE